MQDYNPDDKELCVESNIHICIYIRGAFNKFPDFFVQALKINK